MEDLAARIVHVLGVAPPAGSFEYGRRASVVTLVLMRLRAGGHPEAARLLARLGGETGDARWMALAEEVRGRASRGSPERAARP